MESNNKIHKPAFKTYADPKCLILNMSSLVPRLQLDLWYVILNGAVEISHPEGRVETLCMGNSFGISPSLDKQYMSGEVRTKGDDCQVKKKKKQKKKTFDNC